MIKPGCLQDFLDRCEEIEIRYENKIGRLCKQGEKDAIFVNLLRARYGMDGIKRTLGGKRENSFKRQNKMPGAGA